MKKRNLVALIGLLLIAILCMGAVPTHTLKFYGRTSGDLMWTVQAPVSLPDFTDWKNAGWSNINDQSGNRFYMMFYFESPEEDQYVGVLLLMSDGEILVTDKTPVGFIHTMRPFTEQTFRYYLVENGEAREVTKDMFNLLLFVASVES